MYGFIVVIIHTIFSQAWVKYFKYFYILWKYFKNHKFDYDQSSWTVNWFYSIV